MTDQHIAVVPRWRQILDVLATLSVVAASLSVTWAVIAPRMKERTVTQPGRPSPPAAPSLPGLPITLKGAETLGNSSAKVAVIVYSDFQCPFCKRFANDTLPEIRRRYVDTGQVLLAFRHLPLTQIHPLAAGAAASAVCFGRQGRFWDVHDAMFNGQAALDKASLTSFATQRGLVTGDFATCLDAAGPEQVKADSKTAAELSVTGTPTIFVGVVTTDGLVKLEKRLPGAVPASQLGEAIDAVAASTGVKASAGR